MGWQRVRHDLATNNQWLEPWGLATNANSSKLISCFSNFEAQRNLLFYSGFHMLIGQISLNLCQTLQIFLQWLCPGGPSHISARNQGKGKQNTGVTIQEIIGSDRIYPQQYSPNETIPQKFVNRERALLELSITKPLELYVHGSEFIRRPGASVNNPL